MLNLESRELRKQAQNPMSRRTEVAGELARRIDTTEFLQFAIQGGGATPLRMRIREVSSSRLIPPHLNHRVNAVLRQISAPGSDVSQ